MGKNFSNRLLAGVTAATIWIAITLWGDADSTVVGLGALVLLVVVTAASVIIGNAVSAGRPASRQGG